MATHNISPEKADAVNKDQRTTCYYYFFSL